jgi:hypothetical protein
MNIIESHSLRNGVIDGVIGCGACSECAQSKKRASDQVETGSRKVPNVTSDSIWGSVTAEQIEESILSAFYDPVDNEDSENDSDSDSDDTNNAKEFRSMSKTERNNVRTVAIWLAMTNNDTSILKYTNKKVRELFKSGKSGVFDYIAMPKQEIYKLENFRKLSKVDQRYFFGADEWGLFPGLDEDDFFGQEKAFTSRFTYKSLPWAGLTEQEKIELFGFYEETYSFLS